MSFYVGVKCNNSQCTFQYFSYRLIKQVALLKIVFHLKFLKLNLAKTTLNLSKDIGKTRGLRVHVYYKQISELTLARYLHPAMDFKAFVEFYARYIQGTPIEMDCDSRCE